ncbi:MAG: C39 family peptidase [Oscillospiraceae bacterium]|nr:C39 family peptidase [Oscillospiraceae bacterium]
MKRIVLIFLLLAILTSIAVPCYASTSPMEEPTEATEEAAIITAEQDNRSERPNDTGKAGYVVPSGLQEADESVILRFFEEHPEELAEPDDSFTVSKNNPTKKASWVWTIDGSGHGFYYYPQQEYYTCVAACARMCLRGVSGISVTEASVVKAMNLTPTQNCTIQAAVNYLNSKQGNYHYNEWYSLWSSGFHRLQLEAVCSGAPTMIGIAVPNGASYWPYATNGHCVACYGMMDDKSYYMIADPAGGYESEPSWRWYSRTASQVWAAYSSVRGHGA